MGTQSAILAYDHNQANTKKTASIIIWDENFQQITWIQLFS